MKRLFLTLLFLTLILALLCPALAAAPAVATLKSLDALTSAAGGVVIPDAPQGATEVQYSLIGSDPPTAQIRFTLDGATYHLRARACDSAESAGDLSGMKGIFGKTGLKEVASPQGQSYQLGAAGKNGFAQWYSDGKKCAYSLVTDQAADLAAFQAFVETLQQSVEAAQSVQEKGSSVEGAVKKIGKNGLTVTDASGKTYSFTISGRTVDPDHKKIKKGSAVRVNYSGEYADGCEALSVTLTDASGKGGGGGKGGKHTPKPSATPKPTATPKPDKKMKASGVLTMVVGNVFELQTAKGESLTFMIEDAEVKNPDDGVVGNKASVEYNVANGTVHLQKVTFTHVEPTPTPAPPMREYSGVIVELDSQSVSVQNEKDLVPLDFEIKTSTKLRGDLDADVDDNADVTYYVAEDGGLVATVVVFSKDEPDPDPGPMPGPIVGPIIDPVQPDDDPTEENDPEA